MATRVRSHAKINLGLYVGAPRADGFHPLATVYQTLALYDVLTVEVRPADETRIALSSNDERVPTDERNTAWKMVSWALEELGAKAEVHIHIDKRLPVQGGMGAGSANAVAALVGLEAELGQRVSKSASQRVSGAAGWAAKRLELAARVGSDVPLFLIGGAVLGLDRGQQVYPLPDLEPVWCVVALPELGVSTPAAFRDWDALCAERGLTAEASAGKLNELSRAYASAFAGGLSQIRGSNQKGERAGSSGVPFGEGDLARPIGSELVRTGITSWIENDFERVVFRQHPSLAEIKQRLLGPNQPERAVCAMLSGSGSALFGLYLTREAAEAALRRLNEAKVRGILTRTLPRQPYWEQMLEASED
jgi:4-diphosphocytidyl-2-C-methyl-D-erythritol kinase